MGNAPDTLGERGRASLILELLRQCQGEQYKLMLYQAANKAADGDPAVPAARGADGQPMSYEERFDQLRAAEERLVTGNEKLMPAVQQLIDEQGG